MHIIDLYIGDVSKLKEDTAKRDAYLQLLSKFRRNKSLKYKSDSSIALSIGVGYLLRIALSQYGINEMYTDYGFSDKGKPYILNYPMLEFNLSHSNDKVMCVISPDGIKLGCDIESKNRRRINVTKRFFTKSENEILNSLTDEDEKNSVFTELWTLKESFIKCTGEGLSRPMDSFGFKNESDGFKKICYSSGFEDEKDLYYCICYDDIIGYKYSLCYKKISEESNPLINKYFIEL